MPRLSLPLAGPALLLLPAVQVLMKRRLSLPDGAVMDHQGARLNRWRCLYDDVCSWDQRLWPHSSLLQLSFISLLCWWPPPYPVFSLSFACQVQYPAQQNVAVQCACAQESGGVCTAVRLRACRDIQAGAELLIYGDPEGKSRTTGLSGGSAGLRGAAAFVHVSKKHECTIMTLMFNYLMLIWTPKTLKLSSSEQSNLPKMNVHESTEKYMTVDPFQSRSLVTAVPVQASEPDGVSPVSRFLHCRLEMFVYKYNSLCEWKGVFWGSKAPPPMVL